MLRADKIQLALLTIVFGRSEHRASFSTVTSLAKAVEHLIGSPVRDHEVTAGLLDAYDNGFLRIGRYVGTTPIPMDRSHDDQYFYDGQFYFTPTPKAHRRQQELARDNRHGIFISHVTEERSIAILLQSFFHSCFPDLPVFVSSDRKSIDSGDKWYDSILDGLRKSNVVIVLLSRTSIDRRWTNFEAGIGMGQASRVIPVVCRGFDKNDIGLPLGQLQARDLRDAEDIQALVETTARDCHLPAKEVSIGQLLSDIANVEPSIPTAELNVAVFRMNNQVHLAIRNNGNRPIEMVDAELLLPKTICTADLGDIARPVRERIYDTVEGIPMIGYRLTTHQSLVAYLGVDPLRQFLDPLSAN